MHLFQDCSSVFVLKEGSIIESGTYDELKKNGNEMINNYVVTQDMDVEKGTEEVKQTSKDDKKMIQQHYRYVLLLLLLLLQRNKKR